MNLRSAPLNKCQQVVRTYIGKIMENNAFNKSSNVSHGCKSICLLLENRW
jgi:hypothetical protein